MQEVRVQMPCADFVLLWNKQTEISNQKEIHTMMEFLIMLKNLLLFFFKDSIYCFWLFSIIMSL